MNPIVEIRNLRKTFGPTVAVDNVSFSLPEGKVFGFVGPNGAGKTTTLRIMATLDEPDGGDVLINGRSIISYPEDGRRLIGFMPDALPEFGDITAHEYLDFFGRVYGLEGAALDARVREVEEFTGLFPFREKTLAALSKGMKQRVCLARALVHDPAVLLLDEPAAGLDPRARIELRDMIHALAQRGKTLLVSSHILSELAEMCNGILIIERGKLLQTGTLEDLAAKQRAEAPEVFQRVTLRVLGDPADNVDKTNAVGAVGGVGVVGVVGGVGVVATPAPLEALLRAHPGVKEVKREAVDWHVTLAGGDPEAADLLAALFHAGFRVASFHARRTTLEDIFMNLTKGELA